MRKTPPARSASRAAELPAAVSERGPDEFLMGGPAGAPASTAITPQQSDETKSDPTRQPAQLTAPEPGTPTGAGVATPRTTSYFLLVGVGASAGGLRPLTALLESLPDEAPLAVVVVIHMARRPESALPELLQARVNFTVVTATNDAVIEPRYVYVAPPGAQLRVLGGRLRVTPREATSTHVPDVIDTFFQSLALTTQHRCVGVILSGAGTDGAKGLRDMKQSGAITLAQVPDSAKYPSMPEAAIASGAVDAVLRPEEMGLELARLARHPVFRCDKPRRAARDLQLSPEDAERVFSLLRQVSSVDFSHYKPPTIQRRLQRRLMLHRFGTLEEYLGFLQQNPSEVLNLYQDLLIHVTRFFRDSAAFDAFQKLVVPRLFSNRELGQPIRVWVPGCSTGEEPYSIAITLLEYVSERAESPLVQIFATDVSETALSRARAGIYPESISADVSPERLRRFFARVPGKYRITKAVRDLCVFARHDVTCDPPFSKLDLIVCRNLLIYLGTQLQKKLMNTFHYALKAHGALMLGTAETAGPQADLFERPDRKHSIYFKISGEPTALTASLFDYGVARHAPNTFVRLLNGRKEDTVQTEANHILLERFVPPGVVVDAEGQIVQTRGHTGAFLELAPGDPSLNVLKMAREGLLHGLRSALHEAQKTEMPARREGLRLSGHGEQTLVDIEVIPLPSAEESLKFFVCFQNRRGDTTAILPPSEQGSSRAPVEDAQRVQLLHQELEATRQNLHSMIQDLETANEELQSANEEILSSNEELQSTNEELDTAKEELQSTNEELNTVNEELHGRNEELSRLNSDLLNLLGSVQIAIVMVASDLRIRRFTPMAERVLNLIPADVGRPISHIKPNVDCPDLEELISDVIQNVASREREVHDRQGHRYVLRLRPYKDMESRIDGAVLALFDVQVSRPPAGAPDLWREVFDASLEATLVLDGELRWVANNRALNRAVALRKAETYGEPVFEVLPESWHSDALEAALRRAVAERMDADVELTVGAGDPPITASIRVLADAGREPPLILLTAR